MKAPIYVLNLILRYIYMTYNLLYIYYAFFLLFASIHFCFELKIQSINYPENKYKEINNNKKIIFTWHNVVVCTYYNHGVWTKILIIIKIVSIRIHKNWWFSIKMSESKRKSCLFLTIIVVYILNSITCLLHIHMVYRYIYILLKPIRKELVII